MNDLLATMTQARERFMELVNEVRPELHRYCVRMTGSVFDGEDVVQDTLAKAYFALSEHDATPHLRPWLFRIAHNTAMDFVRRYEHRHVGDAEGLEAVAEMNDPDPDGERVEAALTVFAGLPPLQRSALALKDVLGLSLEETAAAMNTTVPAVKAALVRARANVEATVSGTQAASAVDLERLRSYAHLFNARDWGGLRALFGDQTQLDVVSRYQRRGRSAAQYYTQYADIAPREDLRAEAGWVDGIAALAIFRPSSSHTPAYFIRLAFGDDGIERVRDFRYVPYIATDASFTTSKETP